MKLTVGQLRKLIKEEFVNYDYHGLSDEEVETLRYHLDVAMKSNNRQMSSTIVNALEGDEYARNKLKRLGYLSGELDESHRLSWEPFVDNVAQLLADEENDHWRPSDEYADVFMDVTDAEIDDLMSRESEIIPFASRAATSRGLDPDILQDFVLGAAEEEKELRSDTL
jgi:hypothetical protein